MPLPPKWILLTIVFVEGFAVLAAELLAIRQIIPYTGNGTDTISIIIAAVLLPLAIGNYMGGRYKPGPFIKSVRQKLILNILIAMAVLTLGLSYHINQAFFRELLFLGISNRHLLSLIYVALFMITPVYLLGQTLPLISHYFHRADIQRTTGKILFASTFGSFMGSVFCTLVLMATIGVHYTVVVLISALAALVFVLSRKMLSSTSAVASIIALAALGLNNGAIMKSHDVVANNEYHMIQIETVDSEQPERTLRLNGNISSRYSENENVRTDYDHYINRVFFNPIALPVGEPKNILVIGAGGFTMGIKDRFNTITYIDIDEELLEISEKLFLKQKLSDNKSFKPIPARAFLTQAEQKDEHYDMIVLDVFQANTSIPEHLITREFYEQVYGRLKDGGIMVGNFSLSPHFSDVMSRRLDETLRSVFGPLNRHVLPLYNAWNDNPDGYQNVIYSAYKLPPVDTTYTDDKNPSFYDKNRKSKD